MESSEHRPLRVYTSGFQRHEEQAAEAVSHRLSLDAPLPSPNRRLQPGIASVNEFSTMSFSGSGLSSRARCSAASLRIRSKSTHIVLTFR